MNKRLIAAFAGFAMMCTVPTFALAHASDNGNHANSIRSATDDANAENTNAPRGIAGLLQRANDINQQEQSMASMLQSKAGDNQALKTFATTLREDHRANESALETLASQQNVKLDNRDTNKDLRDRLDNLNGGAFNAAFLNNEISEHRMALREFEQARNQEISPDMRVYIDQTIPVIRAHLEMAEALKRDMKTLPSRTSQASNSSNSSDDDHSSRW